MAKKEKLSLEELVEQAIVKDEDKPYEVPSNWVWTRIGTLTNLYRGVSYTKTDAKTIKDDNDCLILRGGNIEDGKVIYDDNVYVGKHLVKEVQLLRKNDVIIVASTGSSKVIGKAAISDDDYNDIAFGAFLTLIRVKDIINKKYISKFFLSDMYRNQMRKLAKGVNINNIKNEHITNLAFPLPPLSEQQRIVDTIEPFFEKLDHAKELIQNAIDSFEKRKSAILHRTFTGELTVKWREKNEFDISWESKPLKAVSDFKTGYAFDSTKFSDSGYQVIRMGNLYNGILDLSRNPVFIKEEDIDENIIKRSKISVGDILLTLTGTKYKRDYGYAVLITEERDLLLNQRIISLTAKNVEKEYLYYYLQTNMFRDVFFSNETGGVNQGNVSSKFVETIEIPIPSQEEQKEIVRILDILLIKENNAQELCDVIDKIDLMKKSILARAFRGELSTNNPEEESAIELLKEILQDKIDLC